MKLMFGPAILLGWLLAPVHTPADDLVLNAAGASGANLVLNRQTSRGDITAVLVGRGSGDQFGAGIAGPRAGFNSSSIAATAVANTLSVNLAGGGSREQSASGSALRSLETADGSARGLALSSSQSNSGKVYSRVETDRGRRLSEVRGSAGSFNAVAVTATAVGNNVSINTGIPVK